MPEFSDPQNSSPDSKNQLMRLSSSNPAGNGISDKKAVLRPQYFPIILELNDYKV
jgi:hypothetical protein